MIYGAAALFYLEWSRLGRRALAECRSINKHTGGFFFFFLSSQMVGSAAEYRNVPAPSVQKQSWVCGPVMVSVTVGSQRHHRPPSWPHFVLLCFVLFCFSFHRENNRISMTLWQNGATHRDHAALQRPPGDVACVEKCCLV